MPTFPPHLLYDIKQRISLYDVVSRYVQWDKKKSNATRRDFWSPCPFHLEKTSSFHINDAQGFYHCFGCGVHGDIVTFVMEKENRPFYEAVTYLAEMAGVDLPKDIKSEEDKNKADFYEIMQLATDFFSDCLLQRMGQTALNYLQTQRGMPIDFIKKYQLGYAPLDRTFLQKHLEKHNITLEDMVTLGLVAKSDNGDKPYARLKDRITFPIRNRSGKVIGFGGRALQKDVAAKYINSPETPLFHKSKTLYHIEKARHGDRLYVCEGYMDVLSLAQFGIENAVAPLGTAMGEEQLELAWKICSEPILCFDGDKAGNNAAIRVMERAIPLLKAGRTLKFLFLPEGLDPDDFIRKNGKTAFLELAERATPFVTMLMQQGFNRFSVETPDSITACEKYFLDQTRLIQDSALRRHYEAHIRQNIKNIVYQHNRYNNQKIYGHKNDFVLQTENISNTYRKGNQNDGAKQIQESLCVLILQFPKLLDDLHDEFAEMEITDIHLMQLRTAILTHYLIFMQQNDKNNTLDAKKLLQFLCDMGYQAICFQLLNNYLKRRLPIINKSMSFLEIKDKWLIWYEDYKTLLGKNEEKKLHNELLPEHTEDEWEKYHIARKIIKQSFEKEGKTKARFVH